MLKDDILPIEAKWHLYHGSAIRQHPAVGLPTSWQWILSWVNHYLFHFKINTTLQSFMKSCGQNSDKIFYFVFSIYISIVELIQLLKIEQLSCRDLGCWGSNSTTVMDPQPTKSLTLCPGIPVDDWCWFEEN